jgi:hypothetical protein
MENLERPAILLQERARRRPSQNHVGVGTTEPDDARINNDIYDLNLLSGMGADTVRGENHRAQHTVNSAHAYLCPNRLRRRSQAFPRSARASGNSPISWANPEAHAVLPFHHQLADTRHPSGRNDSRLLAIVARPLGERIRARIAPMNLDPDRWRRWGIEIADFADVRSQRSRLK